MVLLRVPCLHLKVNVNRSSICIAPPHEASLYKALRYSTQFFYLHTVRFIRNRNELYAFASPAAVGTHLPTPEGWKAE